MGGGGKGGTSTQTVSIPPEVLARYNAVNARAETTAEQPFQQYGGEFVAPLTPTQQAGTQATNAAAGQAQPYYGAATALTLGGAKNVGPLTQGQIGYYQNPYTQAVVNPTVQALQQQQGQQLAEQQAQAIKGGAFGGDRAGLQRAQLQGQQNLALGQAIAPLYQQGYGQAVQTAAGQQGVVAQDLARQMQAGQQIAGLGTGAQQASLQGAQEVLMEDWNRDQNMDVFVSRRDGPPLLLEKERGGRLVPREPTNWVAGAVFCAGDFDNDLRPDLAVVSDGKISICSNGGERREIAVPGTAGFRQIVSVDYDGDGWLDLWLIGEKIRVWRNLGLAGFQEQTAQLGLDQFDGGAVSEIHFADFDLDCDSDVVVALANGGLRYLRNEGGNANSQVKVRLFGTRSNASGLGCKVEIF